MLQSACEVLDTPSLQTAKTTELERAASKQLRKIWTSFFQSSHNYFCPFVQASATLRTLLRKHAFYLVFECGHSEQLQTVCLWSDQRTVNKLICFDLTPAFSTHITKKLMQTFWTPFFFPANETKWWSWKICDTTSKSLICMLICTVRRYTFLNQQDFHHAFYIKVAIPLTYLGILPLCSMLQVTEQASFWQY